MNMAQLAVVNGRVVTPYGVQNANILIQDGVITALVDRSTPVDAIRQLDVQERLVLPGAIDTPMLWENPNVKSGLEQIDKGVLGTTDEIASVIAFLESDEAEFVRGSSVIVDGGRLGKL